MMTKYRWIRHGLAVAGIAALLAGCNGKEDFSDAVIGGDPLGSGVGAGANFQSDDACAPRVIGALVDSGVVANVGYVCDGFYGYTGVTGLPRETEQNFFVCPLGAESVTFLLGGRTARLELGTAYFRNASSLNANSGCTYDSDTGEYTAGVYDADGLYLFSVSDIVAAPSRVDAETSASTPEQKQVRNVSGLLQALDSSSSDSLLLIDQAAHAAIFDTVAPFTFPEGFLVQDYGDFIDPSGAAQQYVDDIVARGGAVSPTADLPDLPSVLASIDRATKSTSAGVYEFAIEQNELSPILVQLGYYTNPVLFSDTLEDNIFRNSFTEVGDTFEFDTRLLEAAEFRPSMLVTRNGSINMGGAFDVINLEGDTGQGTYLCSSEFPEYVSLDATDYSFANDGAFSELGIVGLYDGGSLDFDGRIFDGRAYNGDVISSESGVDSNTDFFITYGELPEEAYSFNQATDRTRLDGTLCGQVIDDQPVLSFLRIGTVSPYPDQEVMNFLTSGGPMRYTLTYQSRENATDENPDTAVNPVTVDVTIHSDGTVLTDRNSDGNPGYPGSGVPAGEFEIGMVSSVFRAPLPSPQDVESAVLNLVVYNHAPIAQSLLLPKYGSHFRARLVPDLADTCDNRLSLPTNTHESVSFDALWYSPYGALEALRQNPGPDATQARYEALRKQAYGYIEAKKVGCP